MSDDQWNQDNAWAEDAGWSRSDDADDHWEEDVRSGEAWQVPGQTVSQPQSGLGIASLVLSIVAGLVMAVPLVLSVAMMAQNPNVAEDDPQVVALGCSIIIGILLAALAGLLGLIGLFQEDRGKSCAVLGLIFSGVEVCGMIGLIVLGLLAG